MAITVVYTAYHQKGHEDDAKSCAKEILDFGKPGKFFVLYSLERKFFNPWDLEHIRKKPKEDEQPEWKWVPVLEQSFRWYMQFLNTRDKRLRRMAQLAERYE